MHAVINEAHESAAEVNDKLPPDLSAIIDNALAKKSAGRYQSMQAMLEDVQRLSLALRFGAQGVPDGVSTPFVTPKRQSSRGSIGQLISRLLSRDAAPKAPTLQMQMPPSRESSGEDFSFVSGPKKSLAVLPFRNLSGDPEANFYALSLADNLTTDLARVGSLIVMPSSSVTKYQGEAIDLGRVKAELGVELV